MSISPAENARKPILIVSASDSSGAAGAAVDIRTAESLGLTCRLALTAVTVQGSAGVLEVFPLPPSLVAKAVQTALSDPPRPASVKVGALATAAVAAAAAEALAPAVEADIPIVVDPVLAATSGGALLDEEGVGVLLSRILPMSFLFTPNRSELLALGKRLGAANGAEAIHALWEAGAFAILEKGGAEGEGGQAVDILHHPDRTLSIPHPHHPGPAPRGTGCALSTAIAGYLAGGEGLFDAVEKGIRFVQGLIDSSRMTGGERLLFPRPPGDVLEKLKS